MTQKQKIVEFSGGMDVFIAEVKKQEKLGFILYQYCFDPTHRFSFAVFIPESKIEIIGDQSLLSPLNNEDPEDLDVEKEEKTNSFTPQPQKRKRLKK